MSFGAARAALAVLAALLFSSGPGCATLVNGPRQEVTVTSDLPGVIFYFETDKHPVLEGQVYTAPATVQLRRGHGLIRVVAHAPSYPPQRVFLDRRISIFPFVNLPFPGGTAMVLTDLLITRAGWYYDPDVIEVRFGS